MATMKAAAAAVTSENAEQAAHDAAEAVLDQLGTNPDLALVFVSGDLDPD